MFCVAVMAFGVPDRLHPTIAKKRFQHFSLISANVKSLRIKSALFPQLFCSEFSFGLTKKESKYCDFPEKGCHIGGYKLML